MSSTEQSGLDARRIGTPCLMLIACTLLSASGCARAPLGPPLERSPVVLTPVEPENDPGRLSVVNPPE